jgi:hypothetical protein
MGRTTSDCCAVAEARATSVIEHLGEGCGVRPTARLLKVSKDTVARLLKVAGRHAARFHDQRVRGLRAQALEFDEQWSFVKKSSGIVALRKLSAGICGTT